ncbi:hypothetical protein FD755_021887 [Muntiacus reevesi]|uniref:Secreted protein n=1 Tax=Muntiacus reevesi TaxID=9886 RepID=A0A5N3W1F7_MUNRE|nr:hypothetical protein FD755_021887 [Muntiacus reevesi]
MAICHLVFIFLRLSSAWSSESAKERRLFLTLCLCFQHFHNNLLLLNKESSLDPVTDTFSTHGTTIGLADVFLRFRQSHENFRAHTTCRFWCFPNLLGINSIARGSVQPGFVRGCIVGQPTMVCQMLHHPERL